MRFLVGLFSPDEALSVASAPFLPLGLTAALLLALRVGLAAASSLASSLASVLSPSAVSASAALSPLTDAGLVFFWKKGQSSTKHLEE